MWAFLSRQRVGGNTSVNRSVWVIGTFCMAELDH